MMKKYLTASLLASTVLITFAAQANPVQAPAATPNPNVLPTPGTLPLPQPQIVPAAPNVNAAGFLLIDAYSGQSLAEKNADQRMAPASLTKMMTSYIISMALRQGRIHLDDKVPISKDAWATGGSKMFVKVGDQVPVRELMQGIIVDSGNDACVAMAEFVAGTQEAFVSLMNQQAVSMGMTNTHFEDVNGLPSPNHYSTPRDMATLARHLVFDFPEDYKWYSQKWFTYNGIKQPNRNRLLWRDPSVDGIKTGHTDDAGFCLVASAQRNNMRLISVVMGAPTDAARADDNQALLTYGFRFFDSHKLYSAGTKLTNVKVYQGANGQIPAGITNDLFVTTQQGQYKNLKANLTINSQLKAPIKKGQPIGSINIELNGKPVTSVPLVALQDDPKGNIWQRAMDKVGMMFHKS